MPNHPDDQPPSAPPLVAHSRCTECNNHAIYAAKSRPLLACGRLQFCHPTLVVLTSMRPRAVYCDMSVKFHPITSPLRHLQPGCWSSHPSPWERRSCRWLCGRSPGGRCSCQSQGIRSCSIGRRKASSSRQCRSYRQCRGSEECRTASTSRSG
jgi:hypothetical protein